MLGVAARRYRGVTISAPVFRTVGQDDDREALVKALRAASSAFA